MFRRALSWTKISGWELAFESSTRRHWSAVCVAGLNAGHAFPDVPPQLQLMVSLPSGAVPFGREKNGAGRMSFQVPPTPGTDPQLAIWKRAFTVPAGGTVAPPEPERMATNVLA